MKVSGHKGEAGTIVTLLAALSCAIRRNLSETWLVVSPLVGLEKSNTYVVGKLA